MSEVMGRATSRVRSTTAHRRCESIEAIGYSAATPTSAANAGPSAPANTETSRRNSTIASRRAAGFQMTIHTPTNPVGGSQATQGNGGKADDRLLETCAPTLTGSLWPTAAIPRVRRKPPSEPEALFATDCSLACCELAQPASSAPTAKALYGRSIPRSSADCRQPGFRPCPTEIHEPPMKCYLLAPAARIRNAC